MSWPPSRLRAAACALALCSAASGCEPAEDDLHGDWFGETACRQGIDLETSLWFEVLTRDT